MNRQYYYLVSILPSLVFGKKLPLDSEKFRQLCTSHLGRSDNESLCQIMMPNPEKKVLHKFFDDWNNWDSELKKELALMRASRISDRNNSQLSHLPRTVNEHNTLINQIMTAKNPLDAEKVLAKARWNQLDNMEFGHYFDFEKIISYALKLKIMERLESFDQIKGMKIFKGIPDKIEMANRPVFLTEL